MGAAILITLGLLFLLDEYRLFYFDNSWPVLLIVIGLMIFAARSGSTEGHVQPLWMGGMPPQGQGPAEPQQTGPSPHQGGDPHR